ncbi:MAG: hypothetical protein AB7R40_23245 [Nitrospiraceae bacterium]
MPKARPLGKGWSRWTHRLGYSFKQGDLRADLWPSWRSWVEPWIFEVWRDGDRKNVLATGSAPSHWAGVNGVQEAVRRIEAGE